MDTSFFRQLGSNSSKGYFIFDVQKNSFCYLNETVKRFLDGDLRNRIQEPAALVELVHPDDRLLLSNYINRLLLGKAGPFECRLQLPDQARLVLQGECTPMHDERGRLRYVAGIAEDITERTEYLAYLMEFGRKKNSTLEILAHDLRGPLAMVQSVSVALESAHQQQDYSDLTTYTRFIGKACESCVTLIMDLLNEEHLKAPSIAVKLERVELVEKVKEVVELFALNKSITQTFTVTAPPSAYASADMVKVDQILNNLISNSIKFTKPDGIINFKIEQQESGVLLEISDNGIGIPEELQPFLFDKYTRAARTGLKGEESRGIGLSIVKDLVEVQGGEIWCGSSENEGTTFYIRLRAAE